MEETQPLGSVYRTRDQCYDFKNIFAEKFGEKIVFLLKTKLNVGKNWTIILVFEKNATKNWQKSQKIVIITSTPVGQSPSDKFRKVRGQATITWTKFSSRKISNGPIRK
jgi:hypothetical protein